MVYSRELDVLYSVVVDSGISYFPRWRVLQVISHSTKASDASRALQSVVIFVMLRITE